MSMMMGDWLPAVQALGWTLLHFLWQGALIGAGYGLFRALVSAERVEARYNAGLIALLLMAISPVATLIAVYPQSLAESSTAMALAQVDAVMSQGVDAVAAGDSLLDRVLPWLVLVWVLGVVVTAGRAMAEWRSLERIAERLARRSPDLEAMLARLSAHFGLLRSVRVLVSEHIDTPTLIGWVKPVILMPAAVALRFPRHQIELILAHEIGHLRRSDHFVNLAQAVIETLLFYHPVVHWISREVRNDREVCCDRLVLRVTRGEPREYAHTLTSLEELRLAPTLALAASGGVLMDRVRRIVDLPASRLEAGRPSLGLSLCLAAAVALAGIQVMRPDRAQLEAIAAGARAMLERLPPPDAAILAGAAFRIRAPKWAVGSPVTPKLAIAPVERPRTAEAPPATPSIAAVPAPEPALAAGALAVSTHAITAVQDLAARAPAIEVAAPPAPAPAKTVHEHHLVVAHSVFPRYPDVSGVHEPVRVDVEFGVAADGTVRDVEVVGNEADPAFGESARRALEEWRFDRASVPAEANRRFRQSFVFAEPSGRDNDDTGCVRRTGSMICRKPADVAVGLPLTIIETNPDGQVHAM